MWWQVVVEHEDWLHKCWFLFVMHFFHLSHKKCKMCILQEKKLLLLKLSFLYFQIRFIFRLMLHTFAVGNKKQQFHAGDTREYVNVCLQRGGGYCWMLSFLTPPSQIRRELTQAAFCPETLTSATVLSGKVRNMRPARCRPSQLLMVRNWLHNCLLCHLIAPHLPCPPLVVFILTEWET